MVKDTDIQISERTESLGDTLKDVIDTFDEDITELQSNVKWLYKYGGSGTGGGSSSGSSTNKWKLVATFAGDSVVNGGTILKASTGTYALNLTITGHNGAYFTYTVKQGTKTITASGAHFDSTTGYTISISIECLTNSYIDIIVADDSGNLPSNYLNGCSFNYIVDAFHLNSYFEWKTLGNTYTPSTVSYEEIEDNLYFAVYYSAAVTGSIKYQIRNFDDGSYGEVLTLELKKGNDILLYRGLAYTDYSKVGDPLTYTDYIKYSVYDSNGGELDNPNKISSNSIALLPSNLYITFYSEMDILTNSTDEPSITTTTGSKTILAMVTYGANAARGNNFNLDYTLTYPNGTKSTGSILNFAEWTRQDINIAASMAGIYTLECTASLSYGGGYYTTTRTVYFKIVEGDVSYDYIDTKYENHWINTNYKRGSSLNGIFSNTPSGAIQMFRTSNPLEYILTDTAGMTDFTEVLFNLSIKYDSTNDFDNTICEISSINNGEENDNIIRIYQNKVTLKSLAYNIEFEIYIPYDSEYHLLTICKKVKKVVSKSRKYELIAYIDGIIEGGSTEAIQGDIIYNKVKLCSGNYLVNLIELDLFETYDINTGLLLSYITTDDDGNSITNTADFSDADISLYFYVYEKYILDSEDENLEKKLSGLKKLREKFVFVTDSDDPSKNDLVKVTDADVIKDIESDYGIPSLHLTLGKNMYHTSNITFELWTKLTYGLELEYSKDLDKSKIDEGIDTFLVLGISYKNQAFEIPSDAYFYFDILGTSTRLNQDKNYDLGIESTSDSGTSYLYTLNFSKTDTTSFLPERKFTLKADHVDSGHSNNVACGKFVNDVMVQYTTLLSAYSGHIKKCLDGFPVLLYVTTLDGDTYYMGIYSFNLGRASYYNLGYKDLSNLGTLLDGPLIISVSTDKDSKFLDGFNVAEVLENYPYYNFSLFDSTILFKYKSANENASNDSTYMLGDILANDEDAALTRLLEFVKSVSGTGAYIYDSLSKRFGDISDGYNGEINGYFANLVPDYKVLYYRPNLDKGDYSTYQAKENTTPFKYSITEATNFVFGDASKNIEPGLDYESSVIYYDVSMAFGLVDSVLKNLNIKTWDNYKYFLAFYDMDSSFDTNNLSGHVSYLAFSDFWTGSLQTSGEVDYSSSTIHNIVYRDYCPLNITDYYTGTSYDVPSSYLWSIARYSRIIDTSTSVYPESLWSSWRNKGGKLQDVDTFMSTYYTSLDTVPEQLFNLDYRIKYFNSTDNSSNLYGTSLSLNFHGRRKNSVKAWLNNRFKILDAYFYVNGESPNIYTVNYNSDNSPYLDSEGYLALTATTTPTNHGSISIENSDVKYLHTIFSTSSYNTKGYTPAITTSTSVFISALDYSPLSIKLGSNNAKFYMLNHNNVKYKIPIEKGGGALLVNLYGSYYWTHLYDITPFIIDGNIFNVNSPNLLYIKGDSNDCGLSISTFNITAPRLEEVILTSPKFSGTLSFNNASGTEFPNMQSIDISTSKIQLTCNNLGISSLNLAGINSPSILIDNCNNLIDSDSIILSDTTLENDNYITCSGTFHISSIYNDINLNGNYINTLELTALKSGLTATIKNDTTLTSLSLTNFENVVVSGCTSLKTINITGEYLKNVNVLNSIASSISLTNCPNLETINVPNNSNLASLLIDKDTKSTITYLNISSTKVYSIQWGDDTTTSGIIDLTNMPKLVESADAFECTDNTGVTTIKFDNNPDSNYNASTNKYLKDNRSNAIRLGSFKNCTNLQRIYGNVIVTKNQTFGGCGSFSIHGSSITSVKYNGNSVVSGNICYMPYLLHTSNRNVVPKSLFATNTGTESMDVIFQSGSNVTNMSFDVGTSYSQEFDCTATTLFDICYFFSNCMPVSSYNKTTKTYTLQSLRFSYVFRYYAFAITDKIYNSCGVFNKLLTYGIPRYLFHNVNTITYFNAVFTGITSTAGYYPVLKSPTSATAMDGFLSPLVNSCTYYVPDEVDNYFTNVNIVSSSSSGRAATISNNKGFTIDNNFFLNPLKKLSTLTLTCKTYLVSNTSVDSVNTVNLPLNDTTYTSSTLDKYGDISTLFAPFVDNNINLSMLASVKFVVLDYSTIHIPDSVKVVAHSLYSYYGRGEFSLGHVENKNTVFGLNSKLLSIILNSFYTKILYDSSNYARTTFTNDYLSAFTDLTILEEGERNFQNIYKYIDTTDFPYDIFNNCSVNTSGNSKLVNINNFFAYVEPLNAEDNAYDDFTLWVELPGRLLDKCTNVTSANYLFYACRIHHTLSSEGFKNCTSLTSLNYAFADDSFMWSKYYLNELSSSASKQGKSLGEYQYHHGPIPYRFLYVNKETSAYTLKNIKGCFSCLNIKPYVNSNPTSELDFDGVTGLNTKEDTINTSIYTNTYVVGAATITSTGTHNIDDELTIKYTALEDATDETYSYSYEVYVEDTIVALEGSITITPKFSNRDYITVKVVSTKTTIASGKVFTPTTVSYNIPFINTYIYSKYDPGRYLQHVEDYSLLDRYKYHYYNGLAAGNVLSYTPVNKGSEMDLHYCCPPDLLNYLASTPDITYLFYRCGTYECVGSFQLNLSVISDSILDLGTSYASQAVGIEGRIPPYLFKNVKSLSSVEGMFAGCRNLSYYCTDIEYSTDEYDTLTLTLIKAHEVPETLFDYSASLINLKGMFQRCTFSYAEYLDGKLYNLPSGLNTEYMFHDCIFVNYNGYTGGIDYPFKTGLLFSSSLKTPNSINYMFGIGDYYSDRTLTTVDLYLNYDYIPNKLYIYISTNLLTVTPSTTVRRLLSNYNKDYVTGDATYVSTFRKLYERNDSRYNNAWAALITGTTASTVCSWNLGDIYTLVSGNTTQYKFVPYTF